jgi:hypothetical protein
MTFCQAKNPEPDSLFIQSNNYGRRFLKNKLDK